jgi:hypothetical protein
MLENPNLDAIKCISSWRDWKWILNCTDLVVLMDLTLACSSNPNIYIGVSIWLKILT